MRYGRLVNKLDDSHNELDLYMNIRGFRNKSNSAIFKTINVVVGYWSARVNPSYINLMKTYGHFLVAHPITVKYHKKKGWEMRLQGRYRFENS